jgi:hypothetical protein
MSFGTEPKAWSGRLQISALNPESHSEKWVVKSDISQNVRVVDALLRIAQVVSGRATDWLGGICTHLHWDEAVFSVRFPSMSQTQSGDGAYLWFLRGVFGGQKCVETGENKDNLWNERPTLGIIESTDRGAVEKSPSGKSQLMS